MATNKNAVLRYNILDACFSNFYKKFFIGDLIKTCNEKLSEHFGYDVTVSRRTVLDDIKFMKSGGGYDAPIISIREGKQTYYQYEDENFSILKKPLSAKETENLNEAMQILNRLKNLEGFNWVNSIATKINAGLELNKTSRKIISFQENEFLRGIEFLSPLYHYILNENAVTVTYKSFKSDKAFPIIFSPHYLKQYNNRWFVFGYNHERESLQNLALDRINMIQPAKEPYTEPATDYDEYFDDIVGVTNVDTSPVKITIEVTDQILPYLQTKPLHGSQKIKGHMLSLEVKHNQELEALLLSFGERIKVLEPESLVEALRHRILKQYQHYF